MLQPSLCTNRQEKILPVPVEISCENSTIVDDLTFTASVREREQLTFYMAMAKAAEEKTRALEMKNDALTKKLRDAKQESKHSGEELKETLQENKNLQRDKREREKEVLLKKGTKEPKKKAKSHLPTKAEALQKVSDKEKKCGNVFLLSLINCTIQYNDRSRSMNVNVEVLFKSSKPH